MFRFGLLGSLDYNVLMATIHWMMPNGYQGHGEAIPIAVAEAWLAHLKIKYPEMRHWTEPASTH